MISHHCWNRGRRGWTCTGSSWPCPRSWCWCWGCWGWRAGWPWAPATRWPPPGSPLPSLEGASSILDPPQRSNLQLRPPSLWTSETITGSTCSFSLVSKFENWKVIFLALNYLWRTSSPNCCFSGNFHFFLTELVFNFASAQNQLPNNTNVDCSAIDYRLCSRITICNYWLFYQYCILAFNLKTLFPNFGLFLSQILQLRVAIL